MGISGGRHFRRYRRARAGADRGRQEMIRATEFELSCDVCFRVFGRHAHNIAMAADAEEHGWCMRRMKSGQRAGNRGLDYCPDCAQKAWGGASNAA